MEKYIVKVSSREQFQSVIDYVGTNNDHNRFDSYEGDVYIFVRGNHWTYSNEEYHDNHWDDDIYKNMGYYTFDDFATNKLNQTPTFATHAQEVDMINSPNHYNQFSREVINTMKGMSSDEEFKGFLKLNAVKYLSRYQSKNGAEDLDKAIWYIEKLKEEITNDKVD